MQPDASHSGFSRFVSRVFGAEPAEYAAALWSFTYFFCVLGSYYMLRPVREAMAVESGPDTIPYLFAGTFVAMLIATPIFGWVASRFPRKQFLPWVYAFFILNILAFWAAFSSAINEGESHIWLSRAFFVWISVFNLYVVTVFWSFMADLYSQEQGRRLFGMISAGGTTGGLIGSLVTTVSPSTSGSRISCRSRLPCSSSRFSASGSFDTGWRDRTSTRRRRSPPTSRWAAVRLPGSRTYCDPGTSWRSAPSPSLRACSERRFT